jgi:transposase InsO family protein
VQRLRSSQRIWSVFAKKRGLNQKAGPPVHDNLVGRDFTAAAPNELWLTDITEHRTDEGKLYLCAIKDVYSNRIVGYSIDSRMKAALAVAALRNAAALRSPEGTVVHSDSETVRTGIPGGSLTRTVMDAKGCWCRVRRGVLDSHSDRQLCAADFGRPRVSTF